MGTRPTPIDIQLSSGRSARALVVPPDADPAEVVLQLALPAPAAVVAVTGGTAAGSMTSPAVADVVAAGVGGTILDRGWTTVTGATDAGVFTMLGRAAAGREHLPAPWVGVAPLDLVTWPGRRPAPAAGDLVPLEPHHSHFVLVEGRDWGDETPLQLGLTTALGRLGAPTAAVLVGGGAIARFEVAEHAAAGRPLVVLAGSGRLADELAAAARPGGGRRGHDDLATVVASTRVIVCDVADGASAVADALVAVLAGPAGGDHSGGAG